LLDSCFWRLVQLYMFLTLAYTLLKFEYSIESCLAGVDWLMLLKKLIYTTSMK
ncbi:hypothetical protein scyTo_0022300, partial [Scyliorhinus torazame]|nr:hypothetical protein [Scyliorhinus torazame]